MSYYPSNPIERRNVFPIRLVPNSLEHQGNIVYGHAPVYEPNYLNTYKHTFLCSHEESYEASLREIKHSYKFCYEENRKNETLVHVFTKKDKEELQLDRLSAKYLYSQYMEG